MDDPIRRFTWNKCGPQEVEELLTREWLVTNGLGGYSTGTISGVVTRRHHGLLVADLPAPRGRTIMLNHLFEQVRLPDGRIIPIGGQELMHKGLELYCAEYLREFRLELGLPVWRFEVEGVLVEKRVFMPYHQNTVYLTYRVLGGKKELLLQLRPSIGFRYHGEHVEKGFSGDYSVESFGVRFEISAKAGFPALKTRILGRNGALILDGGGRLEFYYRHEAQRGRKPSCFLWSPGYFSAYLEKGQEVSFTASTEPWDTFTALSPSDAAESERERRRGLLEAGDKRLLSGILPELLLTADRHFSGRENQGYRPFSCSGRGGAYYHSRLPLVY